MFRGPVVFVIFALGLAVGCSQQDSTPAAQAPSPASPTVAPSAADASKTPVAPPAVRLSGFVPLDDPAFLAANETEYFGDDELVLGVELAGEYRAYPVRMLRYHHIVNDMVGGEPLLVTY